MKPTQKIPDPDSSPAATTAAALGKPWLECAGELAHLYQETERIQKLIDDEFGQIELEERAFPIS